MRRFTSPRLTQYSPHADQGANESAVELAEQYDDWKVYWDPYHEIYYYYNTRTGMPGACYVEQVPFYEDLRAIQAYEQARGEGEWRVYRDPVYGRKYYYNIITGVSTWNPPHDDIEEQDSCTEQEPEVELELEPGSDPEDQLLDKFSRMDVGSSRNDYECNSRVGKQQRVKVPPSVIKYWKRRYTLFSLYDHGIKMDEEGWFSVTPEGTAMFDALTCGGETVVDGFAGVGGNAIQFAKSGKKVIAIDIDETRLEYAKHNAAIYGVEDEINFMRGDFFRLAPTLKADTVFLSPPWGGPSYSKVETYDVSTMLQPCDGFHLFEVASKIAPKVMMFLPRNVDLDQMEEIAESVDPPWTVAGVKHYVPGSNKAAGITFTFTSPDICTEDYEISEEDLRTVAQLGTVRVIQ
ncbi:hypothetical protein SAY87_011119 [Trapa incisa]|uniref:Trimethylguanosine synthase n=1 Tax=Trapa incisa TaxID=236973 RepID=A0AAN7GXF3_9MYRT|nr:hypothetical protein SAY87_011119 [Trapa incisa]